MNPDRRRLRLSPPLALALLAWLVVSCGGGSVPNGGVLVLEAHGEINDVMAGYLDRGFAQAQRAHAAAAVVELDTPGGLDSSMRDIIQHMNSSTVPVIVYVAPSGARAASAGTFITEAAALAAMAPDTNIGAASPVGAGGADITGTEGQKVTNDAVAFIRSLAIEHGRNADWAESAVRKAAALPATEALAQHVVDLLAPDVASLLEQADGRTVRAASADMVLRTRGLPVTVERQSLTDQILDVLSDPNLAFLLITVGGLALAFEAVHPTIFAGVFGVIALVTGLFALGTLPTNWAGAALILLAFGLFVADIYTGGIGVLAAGGVTALIVGGLLLIGGSGAPEVSRWLVVGVAIAIGLLFVGGISALYRSRRRAPLVGEDTLVGRRATVRTPLEPVGYVALDGESWRARLTEGQAASGETVIVRAVHGLELEVRRARAEEALPPPETAAGSGTSEPSAT